MSTEEQDNSAHPAIEAVANDRGLETTRAGNFGNTSLSTCCGDAQSNACAIKLSGSASCCETEKETIFCWNLLIDNCQNDYLCKVALLLDVRSFYTNAPFFTGPGIFDQATWSIVAESGLMVVIDPTYQGTGRFLTLKTLPTGRTAFTVCAVFPRCKFKELVFMKMSAAVFTLQATMGRSNQTVVNVSNYIAPTCNCATCEDPDLVFCDYQTIDSVEQGANLALNDKLATIVPLSGDGCVYQFSSWIIDGVEQLTAPVYYTILNVGVTTTSLPNPHPAVILVQNTGSGTVQYLGNFGAAFGALFQSQSLQTEWNAILNPEFDAYQTVDVVRIVYPEAVDNWSITLIRHDGVAYRYQKDTAGPGYVTGVGNSWDSRNSAYQYCSASQPIELTPMMLTECLYVSWDRTRIVTQENILINDGPITWEILDFNINGIMQGSLPYTYQILNALQLTVNNPGDTFSNNNATFLNQYFALIGLGAFWKAATGAEQYFLLHYPNTAYFWYLTVKRNNGDIYFYSNNGIVTNTNGFNSIDTNYANICEDRPLNYVFPKPISMPFVMGPPAPIALGAPDPLPEPPVPDPSEPDPSEPRTLSRSLLHGEKRFKDATPLTLPPPTNSSEITGLLRQRCAQVHSYLKKNLPLLHGENFKMYLFGSQVRGVSSSGHPDIDVWFVCDALDKADSKPVLEKLIYESVFKLDITHVSSALISQRVLCVEFFP